MNKVNTKVDMRINLKSATWLSPELYEALTRMVRHPCCGKASLEHMKLLCTFGLCGCHHGVNVVELLERGWQEKKRINKEGELVVTSTLTRSQA